MGIKMEVLKNNLTEHGQKDVERSLEISIKNLNELTLKLENAKKRHEDMLIVKDCIHEFDPNEPNGMELIVSTCIKCGYAWYD
jgi:hypothetical protein